MKKIFIILILFTLTGCWNYNELNNSATVTGIAIDYENNNYKVSVLFSNNENNTSLSLCENGNTIYEAIKKIGLMSPKKITISHLSVVIISDDVAKKGITPILDYLLREPESNQNFYLVISKNASAKKILTSENELSDYPSQNITSIIKIAEQEQARITNSDFNLFVDTLLKKGINPISNTITIDKNNNKPILDSLALFKKDKLVGFATTEESIGINILKGNINNLYIPIDNNIILCTNYKINTKYKNNKINILIDGEGMINEIDSNIDINDKKIIINIENKVKKELYKYANKAISKSKEYKTDIFGFGNIIYKNNYKLYNSIENWDEYFTSLDIDIDINFKITNLGSLSESIGDS